MTSGEPQQRTAGQMICPAAHCKRRCNTKVTRIVAYERERSRLAKLFPCSCRICWTMVATLMSRLTFTILLLCRRCDRSHVVEIGQWL